MEGKGAEENWRVRGGDAGREGRRVVSQLVCVAAGRMGGREQSGGTTKSHVI